MGERQQRIAQTEIEELFSKIPDLGPNLGSERILVRRLNVCQDPLQGPTGRVTLDDRDIGFFEVYL
jgi:hypothetical protein